MIQDQMINYNEFKNENGKHSLHRPKSEVQNVEVAYAHEG